MRAKVKGTAERPRLGVFRSNRHLYAQLIDDVAQHTLVELNSLSWAKSLEGGPAQVKLGPGRKKTSGVVLAGQVGLALGKKILKSGYREIVFDKNGYKYHGQVKALAEGIRKTGVKF